MRPSKVAAELPGLLDRQVVLRLPFIEALTGKNLFKLRSYYLILDHEHILNLLRNLSLDLPELLRKLGRWQQSCVDILLITRGNNVRKVIDDLFYITLCLCIDLFCCLDVVSVLLTQLDLSILQLVCELMIKLTLARQLKNLFGLLRC